MACLVSGLSNSANVGFMSMGEPMRKNKGGFTRRNQGGYIRRNTGGF
jgi:hypothetical protein